MSTMRSQILQLLNVGCHSTGWLATEVGESVHMIDAELTCLAAYGKVERLEGGDGRSIMLEVWAVRS